MNTRTPLAADSEGTRSARRIWNEVPEARSPMAGDPYLLRDTPSHHLPGTGKKVPPKLRLIRLSDIAPVCGIGTCAINPECTSKCVYREADRALGGHYSSRHTQQAGMPPLPVQSRIDVDHRARRRAAMAILLWFAVVLGVSVWALFR